MWHGLSLSPRLDSHRQFGPKRFRRSSWYICVPAFMCCERTFSRRFHVNLKNMCQTDHFESKISHKWSVYVAFPLKISPTGWSPTIGSELSLMIELVYAARPEVSNLNCYQ